MTPYQCQTFLINVNGTLTKHIFSIPAELPYSDPLHALHAMNILAHKFSSQSPHTFSRYTQILSIPHVPSNTPSQHPLNTLSQHPLSTPSLNTLSQHHLSHQGMRHRGKDAIQVYQMVQTSQIMQVMRVTLALTHPRSQGNCDDNASHPLETSVKTPVQCSLLCQHPHSILSILSTHLFNTLYSVNTPFNTLYSVNTPFQCPLHCQYPLTILSAMSTHPYNTLCSVNTPFQCSLLCQHTLSILSILSTHPFNTLYSVNTPFQCPLLCQHPLPHAVCP